MYLDVSGHAWPKTPSELQSIIVKAPNEWTAALRPLSQVQGEGMCRASVEHSLGRPGKQGVGGPARRSPLRDTLQRLTGTRFRSNGGRIGQRLPETGEGAPIC